MNARNTATQFENNYMMKKYLRVILKSDRALWYDIPMPDDVMMLNVVAQLQMCGYVITDKVFVPYDQIAHMCLIEIENGDKPALIAETLTLLIPAKPTK